MDNLVKKVKNRGEVINVVCLSEPIENHIECEIGFSRKIIYFITWAFQFIQFYMTDLFP